ncbi:MAG TPA: hypothetical protein ACFYEE_04475, partial [Candidatus Wujingus californicus]
MIQIYNNFKARLEKFSGTFVRYVAIIKLITTDSIWRFKKESFVILTTSFLGVFFQIWTIGLAIYYARVLEKGENIRLFSHMFQIRTSISFLVVCGIGVLLSLLISAWLIYFSRTRSLALRRRYEEFCARRVLSLFGSSSMIWSPSGRSFSDSNIIFRLARIDSKNIGRVMWMLLDT